MTRLALLLFTFSTSQVFAAEIVSVNPTGIVKQVQQVVVKFEKDAVAMGDPRAKKNPFVLSCKSQKDENQSNPVHSTRWADSKTWVLDFQEPLRSGYSCDLNLDPTFKDLAGTSVNGMTRFSFSTGGPAVTAYAPQYGDIEPEQYFALLLEGVVDTSSVEKNAYFEVEGFADKAKVKVVDNSTEREAILRAAIASNYEFESFRKLAKEKKSIASDKEVQKILVIKSDRRFPERAQVVLHWPKGIRSLSGVAVDEPQKFQFTVIEDFLAKLACERTLADRPCIPIAPIRLDFTQRVSLAQLKGAKLVANNGQTWLPEELKPQKGKKLLDGTSTLTFNPPFPESAKFKISLPSKIKDDLGRNLANEKKFPLETATDEYSPLIKFSAKFGILELKADPILPVSMRNVEKTIPGQQKSYEAKTFSLGSQSSIAEVIKWYHDVMEGGYSSESKSLFAINQGKKFQVPKPLGEKAFELVGIPLKSPGFHVVEVQSPKLGKALIEGGGTMYVASAALVTDMAVHLKKGRESSLVWVTQLSNGQVVSGADVTIVDAKGKELAKAKTDANGLAKFTEVAFPCSFGNDRGDSCEAFVFAKKGDDMSFVSSSWNQGIETYRFSVNQEWLNSQWGPVTFHSILDRMVAQPGDTIHMKHVLRNYSGVGFKKLSPKYLPKRVLITHAGSSKTYTLPFKYDASTGSALGEFKLQKGAPLGRYTIRLSNTSKTQAAGNGEEDDGDWGAIESGSFVVSEYRLPTMKANVQVLAEPLVRAKKADLDLSAAYLSGGPARDLKIKIRSSLVDGSFSPTVNGDEGFQFFAEPVKVGVSDREDISDEKEFLKVQDASLNAQGGLKTSVSGLPVSNRVKELLVEMEYADASGEIKTAETRAKIFPSRIVVGLKTDSWYSEPGKTAVQGVVTDIKGKAVANHNYIVEAFQTEYISHRKRLVGGFYSYDSKTVITKIGQVCKGKSDEFGKFTCQPKNLPDGTVILQARVSDESNNETYSSVSVDIFKAGADSWWVQSDSDRIDLIPEKNEYSPNEKAKFVLRIPYESANVLVTVEREGILNSFVTELKRDKPVIEIPITGSYAPNVYVSALAIRGRVGEPKPTALLDLGRPAMKMGLAGIKVGWKAHELKVTVKPNKTIYKAREKAEVLIQVETADGNKLPANTEITFAAVDEALMRLKENTSWKILKEMMGARPLAVETSSGQNQVIGKRHFGSKAQAPGGGGGLEANARDLFDPILTWQPKIKLDAKGQTKVNVALNDSMTSFRLVAVAIAGDSQFGDGSIEVQSTKDLILYSGLAPLVREGDKIQNAFTVRNTTSTPLKVEAQFEIKEVKTAPLHPFELKSGESKVMTLTTLVPQGLTELHASIRVKDVKGTASDSVKTTIRVEPAVPVRTLQATLWQYEKKESIPVQQPTDAIVGRGGLNVSMKASLSSGLVGVRRYMDEYPYSCLEQKLSKAIALQNKKQISELISDLPSYLDGDGNLKFFTMSLCGSPHLTRYVLNIAQASRIEIPAKTKDILLSAIEKQLLGQTYCRSWWDEIRNNKYQNEERVLWLETLSRYKKFDRKQMSTLRPTPNLWKNETAVAWYQLLNREPEIAGRENLLKQASTILRTRLNFQGTTMTLQGSGNWESDWQLFTSPDQEALGLFGAVLTDKTWAGDIGRLAKAITSRQKRGHWDTTTANAWGTVYMQTFSELFEKEKPSGETVITAGVQAKTVNWTKTPSGDAQLLPWPKDASKAAIAFDHKGAGKPWIQLETRSAIALKAPLKMGYVVKRKLTPVVQAKAGQWKVGDVANVQLEIVARADQPWVVLKDPVPAGASHLGTGLSGSSQVLDKAPKEKGEANRWPIEYDEKSFDSYTAYAAYLPRGTYVLNYRIRFNSAGDFVLPTTRVEAMYSPESFGETPNAVLKVAP